MSRIYRTGYQLTPGQKRTHFRHLAARRGMSTLALHASASLAPFLPAVLDQGDTSSCTGASHAGAIFAAFGAAKKPLPWVPSPRGLYLNARAIDREPLRNGQLPMLEDDGASANSLMRAVNEWGIRPMRGPTSEGLNYDCEPLNVNDEPKLGELEDESLMLVVGDYELSDGGPTRRDEIRMSIAAGHPITIGVAGGCTAFQRYMGGVLPALHSDVDHCVFIYGYETQPDDSVLYFLRNSWGTGWGEGGNARLSEAAVDELEDPIALAVQLKEAS